MPTTRRRINAHALQALRIKKRLTQEELGVRVDLDHTTISRLERGQRFTLRPEVLERFAEALGVPASALCAAD